MSRRARFRRSLGLLLSGVVMTGGLVAVDAPAALASYPVPPTPLGLTAAIEPIQPYIGQTTCQPTAKPGVSAFRNLLIHTYPDTGSLGISRDCGAGGQSEHKEGRAFDWRVSYYNSRQRAEANTLIAWLTKTDQYGNKAAMARRFGIMYMIWNKQIWKAYDPRGWQPYYGASAHRDHVHFSFGWAGAKKVTSYWDRTVAPLDFGPNPPAHVTPVPRLSNLDVVRRYGGTTLALPAGGSAVKVVQAALKLPVDGDYGSDTAAAVARFQVDQRLYPSQKFGKAEWLKLFPPPVVPFGKVDPTRSALGNLLVSGWAIDGETPNPISITATLDNVSVGTTVASLPRDDVQQAYPEYGAAHGFLLSVPVGPDDTALHRLCVTAVNAPGTLGTDAGLGCSTVSLQHDPVGGLDSVQQSLDVVRVTGWALDPDVVDPLATSLSVDGVTSAVVPTVATRADVAAAWPGMGDQHGVTADLPLAAGSHTVCLSATNVAGTLGGTTPVQLACSTVVVRHSPTGVLELVRRVPGGVLVRGWALDPDVTAPVQVDVRSDGVTATTLTADVTRTDLPSSYTDNGTGHGFSAVVDLPAGTHSVCVRVHDAPGTDGSDVDLTCQSVTVTNDPVGVLKVLRTAPGTGLVLTSGDAYDPDTASASNVVVKVDGVQVATVAAAGTSTTALSRWPAYGSGHAFAAKLFLRPGRHTVCLTLANAAGTPGVDQGLSCRTVLISDGTGGFAPVSVRGRTMTVRGWALDPDKSMASTIAVVVDGRTRWVGPAALWRRDLSLVAPGYGGSHGFAVPVSTVRGYHTVCVVSRNTSGTPGVGKSLGCRRVAVY